ncbi:IclR family transcriptional regulator [Rhodoferax sediminis]|uniref:IclR family transcriptional regulator n=1 Tax=Rhodoferax sediminis TaxID=2509614 RepID=A0A515DDJ9_9BURK|nr:IclR family transcriptional regulator [Rhodoferax sediminis]QDL38498.1 IclR family transcriptional regulator [Rhodoferax sediminis]
MLPYDIPPDKQFASTLAKGLELLQCFKPDAPLLGNKDFVARTGLDKATVSRLTYTLAQLGYLRHDVKLSKYRLGAPVLSMGYPLLAGMNLRQIARPWMKELADEVRGTVSIGIRDRADIVYVETCRSEDSDAPPVDIGAPLPLLATAIGHAWLAKSDPGERDKALNQIKVRYPQVFAEHARRLPQALRDFAARGYCTSPGYFRQGRTAVAVPIAKHVNSEIVVFNCAVAASSGSEQDICRHLGPRLITLVRSVEVAMGLL